MNKLRLILLKPSKYRADGFVERFEAGFMPNATLSHIASLTPDRVANCEISITYIDEYIRPDAEYLRLLRKTESATTLLAIIGVQSHQFHRAIDLAAYAKTSGLEHVIIGGPHPMTCDTSILHNRGVSFSLSEAENVWVEILRDAIAGEMRAVYGLERRWAPFIEDVAFRTPPRQEVERHWVPMVGLYPVRGCPFTCNFCSVIKIAGRNVRHPSVGSIIDALKRIKAAGIDLVVFTSDNFNKFPSAPELLTAMIREKIGIQFFFQADTQIVNQPELVELVREAGGIEMFLGVESFDKVTLKEVQKRHNKPETYGEIVRLCREAGIRAHFSNIIGFPHQNEDGIKGHLQSLIELGPELASFYILTPIPGTEQYREFRQNGVIYETNLDRFDTITPTFEHQYLTPNRLQDLLYESYDLFYKDAMRRHKHRIDRTVRNFMAFCRWSSSNSIHPMSGGSRRVTIDHVDQYLPMRSKIFDVGPHLPLPDNLKLSYEDELMNRTADWKQSSAERS